MRKPRLRRQPDRFFTGVVFFAVTVAGALAAVASQRVRTVHPYGILSFITHDSTLTGDGTQTAPLGVRQGAFLRSVNGITDSVELRAGNNVSLTGFGSNGILISASGSGTSGVASLNGLNGAITIAGVNGLGISASGTTITFTPPSVAPGVGSLNGLVGPVTISGGTGVTITNGGNNLVINASPGGASGVSAVNGLTGALTIVGANGLSVASNGSSITLTPPASAAFTLPYTGTTAATNGALVVTNSSGAAFVGHTTAPGSASPGIVGVNDNYGNAGFLGAGLSGVAGTSSASNAFGVVGANSSSGVGVVGSSTSGAGVFGTSSSGSTASGVYGACTGCVGVYGTNGGAGGYAALFGGNVGVVGTLTKSAGSFKIDDPLDPENKYLSHSFVESPDMKNIYDGLVTLDGRGEAVVMLPDWFEALNQDFRYQLTCVGGYAPVYVSREVAGNEFQIAGGRAGLRVSWQLTGTRHDRYANAHRIPVEEMKPPGEQGRYLHPDLYGRSLDEGIAYIPLPKEQK